MSTLLRLILGAHTAENTGVDVGGACLEGAEAKNGQQLSTTMGGVARRTHWRYCSRCRRGNVSRYRKLERVSMIPGARSRNPEQTYKQRL